MNFWEEGGRSPFDCPQKPPDLVGATVCIGKGKFAGHTGKIVERQDRCRLVIDSSTSVTFDFDDMSTPRGSSERSDLAARYRGARVQVVNGGNGNFDLMGRLLKVVVGD